jgi:hypothetical protein
VVEVGQQVGGGLDPRTQPDQRLRGGFRRPPAPPLPHRFHPAEAGRREDQPGRGHHRVGVGRVPVEFERQQRTEPSRHLPPGRLQRGRRGPGVVHRPHPRVAFQVPGHGQGVLRLPLRPQPQRAQPAQHQPALERPGDAAAHAPPAAHLVQQVPVPGRHRAEQHVGVPGGRLGQRGHGGHRAQVQRPLQQAGRDRVVHHQRRVRRRGQPGQRGQVGHPQQRVGRRLGPQHGRPPAELALDRGQVEQVDEDRFGPVRTQPVGQHPDVVVAVAGQQHRPPPLGQGQQQRHRGGLAGGEHHRFGVLEHTQRFLQRLPARVAGPPVGPGRVRFAPRRVHAGRDQRRRGRSAQVPPRSRVDQPRLRRSRSFLRHPHPPVVRRR